MEEQGAGLQTLLTVAWLPAAWFRAEAAVTRDFGRGVAEPSLVATAGIRAKRAQI